MRKEHRSCRFRKVKALLIIFVLCGHFTVSLAQDENKDTTCTFYATIADSMPRYVDGDQAMLEFIQRNIQYPELLKDRKIEGAAHVSFIVMKNGMITGVQVRSNRYSHNTNSDGRKKSKEEMLNDKIATAILNKEALRVVSLLKGFWPGMENGNPVCVQFGVPVHFKPEHWKK